MRREAKKSPGKASRGIPKLKSKLEEEVYAALEYALEEPPEYEHTVLTYTVPASVSKYTPDFDLESRVHIEVKGKFTLADRKKMLLVSKQHPGTKIYLLFGRSSNKLYKGSNTTYAEWADKNGFEWDDIREVRKRGVKKEWLEPRKRR